MNDFTDRPGYSFNPGPPPEASRFLKNKGIKPSFSFRDVEPEEHAVAFTVAKAMDLDVLETIRAEVQRAIDEGLPLADFQKSLRPRLQKLGWWGVRDMVDPATGEVRPARLGSPRRLRTIYNANLRSARAAGQWERIERTKRAFPYLEYMLGPSERHRPHHQVKAGLILPVDDPFWDHWFPPNGWGCKCWVRQVSKAEAARRGVGTAPKLLMRRYLNKRTGVMREVPEGLDPAWDRNPGKLRSRNIAGMLTGKLDQAGEITARVATRDAVQSRAFRQLLDDGRAAAAASVDGPARFIPAGVLPADAMAASGATVRGIIVSGATARKQAAHHPEMTAEDYQRLDGLLADGKIYRDGKSLLFLERTPNQPWLAVVKILPGTRENFLTTLYHVASTRYLQKLLLRVEEVRG